MNDLFLIAARAKWRFPSVQGDLSVEDLFDLPLTTTRANRTSLDGIAIALHREAKASESEVSFVEETNAADTEAAQKLELVKSIIAIKKAERAAADQARVREQTRNRLRELLERKKDQELESKSVEEIEALLASL